MSTLNVSNITDGTTTVGTSYVVNGSAKAWVNFNGTGTIAARDSFNVASLTDNGVGEYTANFSSAMANANYAVFTLKQNAAVNNDFGSVANTGNRLTTSARVASFENAVLTDSISVDVMVQGDLA